MRASRTLPLAAVAALSAVLVAAPAYADESAVLTTGGAAGTAIAVGDVLNAVVKAGTTADFNTAPITEGTTPSGVKCAVSAFTATVADNPVAPGTATESTTAHTFSTCTTNIVGVTKVNSVTVNNLPFGTTVSSAGVVTVSGTATAPIQTTLALGTLLGSISCVYQATGGSITGTASNVDNSITFVEQAFTKTSGSILCPANGYFNATYAPVQDTTLEGAPAVFTN